MLWSDRRKFWKIGENGRDVCHVGKCELCQITGVGGITNAYSENENVSLNGFSDEVGGEDGEGKGTRRESQHRGSGEEHRPTKLEFSKFNNVDIIHETNTLPNGFNMEDTPGKDGEEVACSPVEDDSLVTRLSRADVDMSKKVPQGERDAHNDINCVAKCIDPTNGWASVKNSTDKEREALKLTLKGMNCHDEDANGKCVDEKREAKRHGAIMNSASLKADPTTNKLSDCGKFLEKMEMNKATIVEDAITYIETQQNIVLSFSYELHEMEATSKEIKPKKEEIKNWFNFYS
ncbi:hypothetical protein JHK87_047491 [Glycine soja]|nr:hypothetical protein JHK87_047491 [Glycine soja]